MIYYTSQLEPAMSDALIGVESFTQRSEHEGKVDPSTDLVSLCPNWHRMEEFSSLGATSVEKLDEDFRVGRTVITPLSSEPLRVPLCVLDLGSLQDRIRVPSNILPIVVVGARECLVLELVFEVDHYTAYQGEDFLVGCAS